MRASFVVLIAVLFLAALTAPAVTKTTINGQLVDIACYSRDKENTGNHHKGRGLICARACALEGFPVGILTADGKLYQVMGGLAAHSNKKLVNYMTQKVAITGEIGEKDGHLTIQSDELSPVN
jgi:hypothetical protein